MKAYYAKISRAIVRVYNNTHWFTDKEAWAIFRLFAIAEAVGWTLLISAIVYQEMHLPYASSVIMVAGRIHGMFFMMYFVIVLVTARSMKWGIWRILLALAAGVPPYMSLVFEQIVAFYRRKQPVYVEPPVDLE